MSRRFCLALLLLVAPVLGCSSPEEPARAPSTSYVGVVEGTDARVGLVIDDARGVLYVCGGATTRATLTRWFRGARSGDALDWTADDLRVVATRTGDRWSGELRRSNGTVYKLAVTSAATGTLAGLYEASIDRGRVGVVVFQSSPSEVATLQGVLRTTDGYYEQVLPVREVARTVDGIEVQVLVAGKPSLFYVRPAVP